jgi:hypothetical protein
MSDQCVPSVVTQLVASCVKRCESTRLAIVARAAIRRKSMAEANYVACDMTLRKDSRCHGDSGKHQGETTTSFESGNRPEAG